MKNNNQFQPLGDHDMRQVTGGDFAYDFGFVLREIGISIINGGFIGGAVAVASDLGMNYRPLH